METRVWKEYLLWAEKQFWIRKWGDGDEKEETIDIK